MLNKEGKEGIDVGDTVVAKMPQISKNLLEQREEKCDGGFGPGELHG